jgi:AraC-like DNA-binding protein
MIVTDFRFERPHSQLVTHIGVQSEYILYTISHTGMVYDSRWAPTAQTPPTDRTVLYFVLDGAHLFASESAPCATPSLWSLGLDDVEGALGKRAVDFRIERAPYLALGLHTSRPLPQHAGRASSPPRQLTVDARTLQAARAYATTALAGASHDVCARQAAALLAHLVDEGLLLHTRVDDDTSSVVTRVWSALKLFYDRAYASPSLAELAEAVRLSARQADRLVQQWTREMGVPPEGFRRFSRRWRLKLALMLLSSPDYTITEVARIVGYGRVGGLTNAFAAEGLPSPLRVRELLDLPA